MSAVDGTTFDHGIIADNIVVGTDSHGNLLTQLIDLGPPSLTTTHFVGARAILPDGATAWVRGNTTQSVTVVGDVSGSFTQGQGRGVLLRDDPFPVPPDVEAYALDLAPIREIMAPAFVVPEMVSAALDPTDDFDFIWNCGFNYDHSDRQVLQLFADASRDVRSSEEFWSSWLLTSYDAPADQDADPAILGLEFIVFRGYPSIGALQGFSANTFVNGELQDNVPATMHTECIRDSREDMWFDVRTETLRSLTLVGMADGLERCAIHELVHAFGIDDHTGGLFDYKVLEEPGDGWKDLDEAQLHTIRGRLAP